MCATNGILLGCPPRLLFHTVNRVLTPKDYCNTHQLRCDSSGGGCK
jgi:hypothetical protein